MRSPLVSMVKTWACILSLPLPREFGLRRGSLPYELEEGVVSVSSGHS